MLTVTRSIGHAAGFLLDGILRALVLSRIPPNVLTAVGLLLNIAAACAFGYGEFLLAGADHAGGIFVRLPGRSGRAQDE